MTTEQPWYRTTDPETSRQPVANRQRLKEIAYEAIKKTPGSTAGEIEERTQRGIWKRLNELENDGLITRGQPRLNKGTNRLQMTWYPKENQLSLWE